MAYLIVKMYSCSAFLMGHSLYGSIAAPEPLLALTWDALRWVGTSHSSLFMNLRCLTWDTASQPFTFSVCTARR